MVNLAPRKGKLMPMASRKSLNKIYSITSIQTSPTGVERFVLCAESKVHRILLHQPPFSSSLSFKVHVGTSA
uniref:Uncharacterized protein n=1 Tax=Anopheles atroparvus TaxID=41427 RepID=A0AAG5DPU1_ANOAO